jgi:hypothetical protein
MDTPDDRSLSYCTRCGQRVEPYAPSGSMTLRRDFGFAYHRPLTPDQLVPGDSAYWCPRCQSRWLAASESDTGCYGLCGHFVPLYAAFCGRCGRPQRGG